MGRVRPHGPFSSQDAGSPLLVTCDAQQLVFAVYGIYLYPSAMGASSSGSPHVWARGCPTAPCSGSMLWQ